MSSKKSNKNVATDAIRWIARILGLVLVYIVISIFIKNGIQSLSYLGALNIILNLCLLFMVVGTLLSFKWEKLGGILILVSFICFWILNTINSGSIRLGWIFPLFPIIGAFFLICGLRSNNRKN